MRKTATALFVLIGLTLSSPVGAQVAPTIGLPVGGGPSGLTTSVAFQPSWGGRGRLVGIRIVRMVRGVTRLRIRRQFAGGGVVYDGGVRAGQFIPIGVTRIIWTAWKNTRGNHMNGIVVRPVYR